MNAHKVKSIVKNGQLIIDMPSDFDNKAVEVIVLQVVKTTISDEQTNNPTDYISILDVNQLVEETEAPPYIKSNPNDTIKTNIQETVPVDESGFVPPRQNIDLRTLRGASKLNMSIEEIDSLTKSWRDEWDRDFS